MDWSDRIGRRIKPRDLHVFLAVAEQGNMAKAADSLAISRPVVSKTIADLERALGVRLFDRNPQRVEPTLYGRALAKRSITIFDELRQSVKDIEFLTDPTAGELRVGCPEVMAAGLVGAAIGRLAAQHPKLVFHTELGTIDDLQFHSLRERKCELVIGRQWSSTHAPDLAVESLFHEQLFVVAGLHSRWAARRKMLLAQLLDEPWILSPVEMEPGAPVAEGFRAIGVAGPRTTIWSQSLNLRNNLLASGQFLTVIPGSVLRFGQQPMFKVLPIKLPRWRLPIAIITLKNRTISPVAQLFIGCVRKLTERFAKDG
jgi:DNA-binding transcriptional LysR family regulator